MDIKELIKNIGKKYNTGTIAFYGDLSEVEVQRISCGIPSVDYIIGGGIPEGRVIEIFGPQASGKTTLAIKFLSEVQKKYPGKRVAFIDVEHALDPIYAGQLGLNMKEVIFVQPDSAEDALNIMHDLAKSGEVKAIILDSIAQLVPKKELEGNIGDAEMGMRARLIGQGLRKITPVAEKNGCVCMFINQVRTNIGNTYGNPEVRPGGNALPFAASLILRITNKKINELVGESTLKVVKNKVGMPFRETTLKLEFGKGYDIVQDIITMAKKLKIIYSKGAYYYFDSKKEKLSRMGEEKMRAELSSNNKLIDELKEKIVSEIPNEVGLEEKEEESDMDGLIDSLT